VKALFLALKDFGKATGSYRMKMKISQDLGLKNPSIFSSVSLSNEEQQSDRKYSRVRITN
jgi:hypothetical protein